MEMKRGGYSLSKKETLVDFELTIISIVSLSAGIYSRYPALNRHKKTDPKVGFIKVIRACFDCYRRRLRNAIRPANESAPKVPGSGTAEVESSPPVKSETKPVTSIARI